MPIKTINTNELAAQTGNIYEAIAVASKRARQISNKQKEELKDRMSYFEGFDYEYDDRRNEEQIRISLEFEKRAKPTEMALDEMLRHETKFERG